MPVDDTSNDKVTTADSAMKTGTVVAKAQQFSPENSTQPEWIQSGFAFVATHIDIEGPLPVEIIDGHNFRRARPNEIEIIQKILHSDIGPWEWPMYEGVVKEEKYDGRSTFHRESLAEDKWKYWVVAFDRPNHATHRIEQAAFLLEPDIDFAFQAYFSKPNQQGNMTGRSLIPLHVREAYSAPDQANSNARTLPAASLSRIRQFMEWEDRLSDEFAFITHALKNFASIRRIPRRSELRVVGYFSIIESLTTHAPRQAETLDSIRHQVSNKAILLRKRFERSVDLAQHFSHDPEQTLWKMLYDYRSGLAHGTPVDFGKRFRPLRDHDAVVHFLNEFIKELLKLALREPEFFKDLKQC